MTKPFSKKMQEHVVTVSINTNIPIELTVKIGKDVLLMDGVNGEVWVSLMLTKMNSHDGFFMRYRKSSMVKQKHEIDFKMNF